MDLNTATPLVFDTHVAGLYTERANVGVARERALESLHYAINDKKAYLGRSRQGTWSSTSTEVLVKARQMIADGEIQPWDVKRVETAIVRYDDAQAAIQNINDQIAETEDVYNARGCWQRFFLVPDGHIHASQYCSSFRMTTRVGWLPNLSGHDEASAVAEHGAWLCTKCFPSAPVEWTNAEDVEAAAKASGQCAGSKTFDYDEKTARTGYYTGNYGICSHCDARVTLTSSGALRSHKTA
jgi:hypothetical protein